MEESFNVRVDKVFGSLPTAPSAATATASLWCLTDEEIERREWNRNKGSPRNDDVPKPYPSNLDGFYAPEVKSSDLVQELEDDLDDEEEDDEEEEGGCSTRKVMKPDDYDEEAWGIRNAIGRDCTLDKEEEEDEYDKLAIGGNEVVDNLFLRDVTDYEDDLTPYCEIPNVFGDVDKDPRANHAAARLRLKEDAEAAKKSIDNLHTSLNNQHTAPGTQCDSLKEGVVLSSILKNRENQMESRSKKRVRFDSGCKDDSGEGSGGINIKPVVTSTMDDAQGREETCLLSEYRSVPGYVQNPSKYKHYTFDSSDDIDEAANQRAYGDFLNLVKGPKDMESEEEIPFELPKSLTFTPKKKPGEDPSGINRIEFNNNRKDNSKEPLQKKGLPIAIAAEDEQEGGVCAMEEDEPLLPADDRSAGSRRSDRQYRTKDCADMDEFVA